MSISKLLVVDDSKAIRTFVSRILSNAGYEVITAVDGFQALEKMAEEPSLMLLDVAMPGLDGYGVCEELRQGGTELPIVFLTSIQSKALELLGKEYGAYLNKPVHENELLHVVKEQLALANA